MRRGQRGFTLMEMIIVIAITGVTAGAVAELYFRTYSQVRAPETRIDTDRDARIAFDFIGRDVRAEPPRSKGTPATGPHQLVVPLPGSGRAAIFHVVEIDGVATLVRDELGADGATSLRLALVRDVHAFDVHYEHGATKPIVATLEVRTWIGAIGVRRSFERRFALRRTP